MPRAAQGHFPLTRYFVATGLITAVLVAVPLTAMTAFEVRADLQHKAEDSAVLIAQHVNRQIHEGFIHPVVARDGFIDLDRPEHLATLDREVRSAIAEFRVVALYAFDLEGRITYSTNLEHRGFHVGENPNYARAARGEVSSVVVARGSPLDVGGRQEDVNLLETYVPVHRLDAQGASTGEQTGVIEIYQDATELLEESRQASLRVAAISTFGVVALMLALWLWIRKADATIQARDDALIEANRRLAALSADLERQVEDRSRRLVRAETLASVGTFSAGLAHEVNNPVAAIASCAEGLLRRARSPALQEQVDFQDFPEYLRIIRDEAFRVKGITRNLLDFSRSDGQARPEAVDLGELLDAVARLVGHRAGQEQKTVAVERPSAPVRVHGDPAALRQLVLNVTVNALDATPEGGVIRWRLSATADGAELVCEDEGAGFSPEALERALEPFFTQKPTGQGTGLGLSIAYGVARQHGGAVELGNRPGGGAVVRVRLAASPAETEGGARDA